MSIPSIGLHNALNKSQTKNAVHRSGVILLSLTAFISVFGRFLPPTHRGWTALIFAGHNLLSSAMIMKCGVDTLALLKASNLVAEWVWSANGMCKVVLRTASPSSLLHFIELLGTRQGRVLKLRLNSVAPWALHFFVNRFLCQSPKVGSPLIGNPRPKPSARTGFQHEGHRRRFHWHNLNLAASL